MQRAVAREATTRGAVVTAVGPRMRGVLRDVALPTFERWAQRWGWSVLAAELPTDGAEADGGTQRANRAPLVAG